MAMKHATINMISKYALLKSHIITNDGSIVINNHCRYTTFETEDWVAQPDQLEPTLIITRMACPQAKGGHHRGQDKATGQYPEPYMTTLVDLPSSTNPKINQLGLLVDQLSQASTLCKSRNDANHPCADHRPLSTNAIKQPQL